MMERYGAYEVWNFIKVKTQFIILVFHSLSHTLFPRSQPEPSLSLSLSLSLCTNKRTLAYVCMCLCAHTYLWWWNISIKSNFKMEMLLCPLFVCLFCLRCLCVCVCVFFYFKISFKGIPPLVAFLLLHDFHLCLDMYASDGLRIIMNHFWAVKNMVLFHE